MLSVSSLESVASDTTDPLRDLESISASELLEGWPGSLLADVLGLEPGLCTIDIMISHIKLYI